MVGRTRSGRGLVLGLGLLSTLAVLLASCGSGTPGGDSGQVLSGTLTVYSGRSESLVGPIIRQFGEVTGVRVLVKYAARPSWRPPY